LTHKPKGAPLRVWVYSSEVKVRGVISRQKWMEILNINEGENIVLRKIHLESPLFSSSNGRRGNILRACSNPLALLEI